MGPDTAKAAFSKPEAARYLGCSDRHIDKLMPEFPNAYPIGVGERAHWRIPKADLDAYMAKRRSAHPSSGTPRLTTQSTPADIVTT